jgi:hypothetical protein
MRWAETMKEIAERIEIFYNRQRGNKGLGSPAAHEGQCHAKGMTALG